jgi:hypothetical protein
LYPAAAVAPPNLAHASTVRPEQACRLRLEQMLLALDCPRLAMAVTVAPPLGALTVTPWRPLARAAVQLEASFVQLV